MLLSEHNKFSSIILFSHKNTHTTYTYETRTCRTLPPCHQDPKKNLQAADYKLFLT